LRQMSFDPATISFGQLHRDVGSASSDGLNSARRAALSRFLKAADRLSVL
jgi:hypothetical protein